jgi:hypothetical protein
MLLFLAVIVLAAVLAYLWIKRKLQTAVPGFFFFFLFFFPSLLSSSVVGVQPPSIGGLLNGLRWLRNPTKFLNDTRKELGDVFLLEIFGIKLFFVFSVEVSGSCLRPSE